MNATHRVGAAVATVISLVAFGAFIGSSASGGGAVPNADAASSARAPRAAVTPNLEGTYLPVTPCRIVDGRKALGVIPADGLRSYEVRGTTGFVEQGGKSGGCGIPTSATSVNITVTIVSPTGGGFLRAWPQGQGEPDATLMNYVGGQSLTTTAPLKLGATTEAKDMRFKTYANDAMLVIEVQGYYASQIQASINADGTISTGSPRVLSSVKNSVGTYTLTIDREVSSCAADANADGGGTFILNAYTGSNTVTIYSYQPTGAPTDVFFTATVLC